jgi:Flp pilus assembly protein TadD
MSSILDGMPSSEAELAAAMEFANPMVEQFLNGMKFNPRQQSVIDLVRQGLSLADIFQVTQRERDAVFLVACRQIQAGNIGKARDSLISLYQLEPLDARVIYALAVTYQVEGNFSIAANLYISFLALDATNAEGYLRLGECFLAAREYEHAQQSFEFAKTECERGNGNSVAAGHAARMLAVLAEKQHASPQS